MISEGVDVLVVVPADADAAAEIVKKAHSAGVKVISYDRLIRNADVDYYVSFDNEKVGELQAEAIVKKRRKETSYISADRLLTTMRSYSGTAP